MMLQSKEDPDLAEDDEEGVTDTKGTGSGSDGEGRIPPIVSHWNLAEYLPPSVRQVFLVSFAGVLLLATSPWLFCSSG